jgi:hypothetical protein
LVHGRLEDLHAKGTEGCLCFSTKAFANEEYEEQRDGNRKYVSPKNAYDFVRELFLIS